MSSQVDDRPKNGLVTEDPTLRTYRGRSLEEVLPQIRAELGPDAVIVRQRDGLVGGIGGFFQQQFVEVQARPGSRRVDFYDDEPALPPALEQAAAPAPAPAPRFPSAAPKTPAVPAAPEALLPPAAPAPAAPAPAAAAPAAPTREQLVPGSRPKPRLSAAELLAQATGSRPGDTRTPAEILREHSATFAQQLAQAETGEPIVARATPAPAVEPASGRYAPPVPSATERFAPPVAAAPADEPIPLPQKPVPVPAPEPELPPAAKAPAAAPEAVAAPAPAARAAAPLPPAPVAAPVAAAAAPVKAARRAAKARAARAARARARAPAKPKASAAAAAAKPAAPAKPKARAEPAPAPVVELPPVASSEPELPESGVGPQTTQALELAAAIAANMSAAEKARADAHERRFSLTPRAAAQTGAPVAAPTASTALVPARPLAAPRRSLFGRKRVGPTRPRHAIETPQAIEVSSTLSARGLAPAAARELLVDATAHVMPFIAGGDVRSAVRTALARRIPVPAPPRIGGRVVAFVGAGGGGKTRCSAGLAAAYAHGSTIPVACLTLAPVDGGAELHALLKPHGVKVEVVATPEEAQRRIAELRKDAVVVLDTPAVSVLDAAAIDQLAATLAALELDEIQLTVPATLSATVAQELVERLAPLQPTGIAMTHSDATDHIGAVVELACATRLPLAYVNGGLELPGAFAPADPVQLAERLLA